MNYDIYDREFLLEQAEKGDERATQLLNQISQEQLIYKQGKRTVGMPENTVELTKKLRSPGRSKFKHKPIPLLKIND